MPNIKEQASITLLIILGFLLIVGGALGIEDLWTDADVSGYLTPTNATMKLCIGTVCNTAYEVSISTNASINGSRVCTEDNHLCGNVTNNNTYNNYTMNVTADTCAEGNYSTYNGTGFECAADTTGTETDPYWTANYTGYNKTAWDAAYAHVATDAIETATDVQNAETDEDHDTCAEITGCVVGAITSYTEDDPQVGNVTNTKWCNANGTAINCDQEAPTGTADGTGGWTNTSTVTSTDLNVNLTAGKLSVGNSAAWIGAKAIFNYYGAGNWSRSGTCFGGWSAANINNGLKSGNAFYVDACTVGDWLLLDTGSSQSFGMLYVSTTGRVYGTWTIQGSNDNSTWTNSSTINWTATINQATAWTYQFNFTKIGSYRYWRIYKIDAGTGGQYVTEFQYSTEDGSTNIFNAVTGDNTGLVVDYAGAIKFLGEGSTKYTFGYDKNDADKFKISTTSISTNTGFDMDTSQRIVLGNTTGVSASFSRRAVVNIPQTLSAVVGNLTGTSLFIGHGGNTGSSGQIAFGYSYQSNWANAVIQGLPTDASNYMQTALVFATKPNNTDVQPVERMRITNTGVGIGTITPSTVFNVKGTSTLEASGATNVPLVVKLAAAASTDAMQIQNSVGTVLANIDENGNLGLGVADPLAKVHLDGGITFNNYSTAFVKVRRFDGTINTKLSWGSNGEMTVADVGTFTFANGNSIKQNDPVNYAMAFYTGSTPTSKLVIRENGSVGIGTSDPSAVLDIRSTSIYSFNIKQFTNSAAGATIRLYRGRGTPDAPLRTRSGDTIGGNNFFGYYAENDTANATEGIVSGQFSFKAADSFTNTSTPAYFSISLTPNGSTTVAERLRITSEGYVGISTATPTQKLDVNGSGNFSGTNAKVWINGSQVCTTANGLCALTSDGNNYTTGVSFTGTTTKTIQISIDGRTNLSANFTDIDTTNTSAEMIAAVNNSGISIGGNAATVTNGLYTTSNLNASKVNTGSLADAYIANATTWHAKYDGGENATFDDLNVTGTLNVTENVYFAGATGNVYWSDGIGVQRNSTCLKLAWNSTNYVGVGPGC